jgi:hypothetical protein
LGRLDDGGFSTWVMPVGTQMTILGLANRNPWITLRMKKEIMRRVTSK